MNYIVTTTIHVPELLGEYVKDFQTFGHEYEVVVAGDKKTPTAAQTFCENLPGVTYLDIETQYKMFGKTPLFRFIPYNSIDRRNFAYLYCLKAGLSANDTLITIDDDNFLHEKNFIGMHSRPIQAGQLITADTPVWYNPLESFYDEDIHFRGSSMYARTQRNDDLSINTTLTQNRISVNQGLWENSPDIDAISRMTQENDNYHVTSGNTILLGKNALAPTDTQNTAYLNGFGVTAFLPPYIGRFDDIFSSYITKRISDETGFAVAYGSPVARQDRNPHNTYNDFLLELHGMSFTDTFISALYAASLSGKSLLDLYATLAEHIQKTMSNHSTHAGFESSHSPLWGGNVIAQGMHLWLATLDALNIQSPNFDRAMSNAA